jgi:hypothetical protein
LIDGGALMPAVDPVAAPAASPVGEIVGGLLTFEAGTFNGSVAQPNAWATPPIDVLNVEQGT